MKKNKVTMNPAVAIDTQTEDNMRIRYLNQYDPDEEQRLRVAIRELCPNGSPKLIWH